MTVNFRLLSIAALVMYGAITGVSAETKAANNLFSFSNTSPSLSGQVRGKQAVVATHTVNINRQIASLEVGQSFVVPLPDENSIDVTVVNSSILQNGDRQLKGSFDDNNEGSVIITFGSNATFANINSTQHSYAIGLDDKQKAFLVNNKLTNQKVDLSNDMIYPPNFEPMSHLRNPAPNSGDNGRVARKPGDSEVALLFIYSNEFATGFSNPVTRINQMIAFTNDAYTRSGINIELKLAHARQINFNNSENISTLLTQVRTGAGSFSNVSSIRDQYYADMVAVLPFKSSGGIGGVAYVGGNSPSFAFSVSQFAQFGSDSLFAHEIGHNLGSGHERISANSSQPDPCTGGYTGYACGHGNGNQGTIMSYLDDSAWSFVFSNPLLDCNGEPCGIAQAGINPADNRASFNITGPLTEAFRVDNSNDDDKDGVKNDVDNCPNVVNPNQLNTDSDSLGDACDSDDDNDGVSDSSDNCRLEENADQLDSNGNGVGDVCESDEMCFPVINSGNKVSVICL